MSFNVIQSTLSEAWKNELPLIGFSVDCSGTAMTAEKFPETDCYLRLSRPPRGSLEFLVKTYKNRTHNHNTLREFIQGFGLENRTTVNMGKPGTIRIGDIDRRACEFLKGKGLSRKKWKAAIIPSPDGGPYGLIVMFGLYVGSSESVKRVRFSEHPVFKALMDSFELTNGR
ncbi:MAG: hypothetical protein ACXADL_07355 [Candidatus Thorarchaeota archaeon]|jgi:hypothetical protein